MAAKWIVDEPGKDFNGGEMLDCVKNLNRLAGKNCGDRTMVAVRFHSRDHHYDAILGHLLLVRQDHSSSLGANYYCHRNRGRDCGRGARDTIVAATTITGSGRSGEWQRLRNAASASTASVPIAGAATRSVHSG